MIIFMETVEEKFEIRVPESAIGERKFNTFNDIVKLLLLRKENSVMTLGVQNNYYQREVVPTDTAARRTKREEKTLHKIIC